MIAFACAQLYTYSMGVMIEPLQQEFGWSRAAITSGMIISSTIAFLLSSPVGSLVDRYGARRVGILGLSGFFFAFALLSTVGPTIWTWWGAWILLGSFSLTVKPTTWSTAISSRFFGQRALALAILFCGAGLASATVPLTANMLLEAYGWRGVYVGLALIGATLSLPLLWFFLHDGRNRPFRSSHAETMAKTTAAAFAGLGVREAILSTRFVQLALAGMLMTGLAVSLTVHFVPMLTDAGLSRTEAAATTGLLGVGSVTGRLVTGYLLDRFNGPLIGAISFLTPIPAILLLLNIETAGTATVLATLLLGLSIGAESDVLVYLATRYFGLRNFGAIYGAIIAITALGSIGPTIVGHVYDLTGSYRSVLEYMIPIYVASAFMVVALGPYPRFDGSGEGAAPVDQDLRAIDEA